MKTNLSVNVNKIALIRNSRGGNMPNLIKIVQDIEAYGADGITVHPRPDERHIRYSDIPDLMSVVKTEFNVEGNPSASFMKLVLDNRPAQVTLVPDKPHVLTSNSGWDVKHNKQLLSDIIQSLHEANIRVSIFIEPDCTSVEEAHALAADRVELYTGHYAQNFLQDNTKAIAPYCEAAQCAAQLGIGVNAGHDLNLDNLAYFSKNLPNLLEVSIGHALVTDSLYYGLKNTVQMYQRLLI